MIAFQPHAEEKLRVYDRFVDAEGRTTLNMAEYMEHRKALAEKAIKDKKLKTAKKGSKFRM